MIGSDVYWVVNKLETKVQNAGFQDQEDGTLLEGEGNAGVRNWYTRTGLPKFVTYSMPTKLRSCIHRHQSLVFELPNSNESSKSGLSGPRRWNAT
ncbi:hypothetical protein NV377_23555 [Paenibacillus sp. T3-5-0-4]|nr:hypothetical protein [Paenibacillus endoradicis]